MTGVQTCALPISKEKADGKLPEGWSPSEWDWTTGYRITVLADADHGRLHNAGDTLFAGRECSVLKFNKDNAQTLVTPSVDNLWPLHKRAGLRKMTIQASNGEYAIECGVIKSGRCNRRDALVHLVKTHGLRKDAAMGMLRSADWVDAQRSGPLAVNSWAARKSVV